MEKNLQDVTGDPKNSIWICNHIQKHKPGQFLKRDMEGRQIISLSHFRKHFSRSLNFKQEDFLRMTNLPHFADEDTEAK